MNAFDQARALIEEFKSGQYLHGDGVLDQVGEIAASAGKRAALVRSGFSGIESHLSTLRTSLATAGVEVLGEIRGPRPNAPVEDLLRIKQELDRLAPDCLISFGGGSLIDCVKAADVLRVLGGKIDDYFGVGLVTQALQESGRTLSKHVAIQAAASSAAHLTKYSNITDLATGQKKLIVDEAIVPSHPVFDYSVTHSAPFGLTADGALDSMAHILEVFYGANGKPYFEQMVRIAEAGLPLIIEHLPRVKANPRNQEARDALGLASDLGGYAIMLGGTNGAHLTSFSLVDILSHGRACALMQPYYTVFFSPVIEQQLRMTGELLKQFGYIDNGLEGRSGRALGDAVARGLFEFARAIGFPITLGEVPGFGQQHIDRALTAAKNPQLKMKLENMPVPLSSETVDTYMGPILEAARDGDLGKIRNIS